ncbi:reverse transcriptase N-terminal domain-containing protein [Pseudomonas putida]|nr:reverse transcriptase N-terminal domain-containing protein [Pseudomonas putida]
MESQVKRLQVRVAYVTREGRWGKVQDLQRLLNLSFSGKLLAMK